jgi:hypothetical protein
MLDNGNKETTMEIATEISRQIGNRAMTMIGASNLLGDTNSLQFKIGKNSKKVTHVRVTLDASDTYTVEFIRVGRGFSVATLATVGMVYADHLRAIIQEHTGMYVNL